MQDSVIESYTIFGTFDTNTNDCYCAQELKNLGTAVRDIAFPDGETKPCKEWFEDYTIAQTIGTLISLSLSVINGLLRFTL